MRITGKRNRKEKKSGLLMVCAVLAAVAASSVGIYFAVRDGDSVTAPDTQDIAEAVNGLHDHDESLTVVSPTPTEEPEEETTPEITPEVTPEEIPVMNMCVSTESDEASLRELVVNTLALVQSRVNHAVSGVDGFDAIVNSLEASGFTKNQQLLDGFQAEGVITEFKTFDVAGWVGSVIFWEQEDEYLLQESWCDDSHYLGNLVGFTLYDCGVKSDEMTVQKDGENWFVVDGTDYDVNFRVNFAAEDEDWVAIVGNVEEGYVVLDIVNALDLQGVLVAKIDEIQLAGNDQQPVNTTQPTPQSTPVVTPEPTQAPTTTNVPDAWYDAIVKSGVDFGYPFDPTNMTFGPPDYGYDGDRSCYRSTVFLNGEEVGLITVSPQGSFFAPSRDYIRSFMTPEEIAEEEAWTAWLQSQSMPDFSADPCIFDENGVCISTKHIHEGSF